MLFSPALNGYIKESKIMGVNGKGLSVVRLEDAEWRVSRDAEADWLKEEFKIVDRDAPLLIIYRFKITAFHGSGPVLPTESLDSKIYNRFTGSIRPLPLANVQPSGEDTSIIRLPDPESAESIKLIAHLISYENSFICGRLIHKSPAYSFSVGTHALRGQVQVLEGPLDTRDLPFLSSHKYPRLFFSATFADSSGDIQGFTYDTGVTHLIYDKLKVGKVYYVGVERAIRISEARKWKHMPGKVEFEFQRSTEVEECLDPNVLMRMPEIQHRIIPLDQLDDLPTGYSYSIDVVGVLLTVNALDEEDDAASNNPLSRRKIIIVDSSYKPATIVLRGWAAILFNSSRGAILVFRGVIPNMYEKIGPAVLELEAISSTITCVDPEADDLPGVRVGELRAWWESEGDAAL